MKKINAEELRFLLLPSANPPRELVAIHNKAFALWVSVWKKVLQDLNFSSSSLEDDFLRQDHIACIAAGDEPAALHLYTYFSIDCDASVSHSYMKNNYPAEYFSKLREMGVRDVMSMEYMTVHSDWRKSQCDVHLGAILAGLACRTMQHFGQDGAIAPARRDHKVNEIAYAHGGETVISDVINHNIACDLLIIQSRKVRPHEDPRVNEITDALWEKREYMPAARERPASASVIPFPLRKKVA